MFRDYLRLIRSIAALRAFEITSGQCPAKAGSRPSRVETGSVLKAGYEVVVASTVGFAGALVEAENLVRIKSPWESATNSRFPNMIS